MGPLDTSFGSGSDAAAAQFAAARSRREPADAPREETSQQDANTGAANDAGTGNEPTFNLERLADALGVDPDDLLRQIASGEGIGSGSGQAGAYGTAVPSSLRAGLLVDRTA